MLLSIIFMLTLSKAVFADVDERLQVRLESKVHYRNSEENRFAVQFPFPSEALPVGETNAFLETVDAGDHIEVSTINAVGQWRMGEKLSAHFKVEVLDKYDRNPTSSDYKIDLDSGFLRYGDHVGAYALPDDNSYYVQIGKFAKFERQRARRTESYGLVSTAFNRFEDSGLEIGFDLLLGLYAKASWTTGNPVFIRDPNALAGDNGTNQRRIPPENPDPELKSGIVILYDAEIETLDLGSDAEAGAGLGYRWKSERQGVFFNIFLYGYQRKLVENRVLHGTFYGADLDLFDLGEVPGAGGIRLPAEGDDKRESGVNIWFNYGNFSLFAQAVDQDAAELGRKGTEIELSYVFDFPIKVSPVIRYSKLDNDFEGSPFYPAPSVWWDWEKYDYGLNVDLTKALRLTIEYADNRFIRRGKTENNNETLVTFRWRH